MSLYNFQRSLAAVLVGNLIYFALLMPVLPAVARHAISLNKPQIDLGLVIDFAVCSILYVLFGRIWPEKKGAGTKSHS